MQATAQRGRDCRHQSCDAPFPSPAKKQRPFPQPSPAENAPSRLHPASRRVHTLNSLILCSPSKKMQPQPGTAIPGECPTSGSTTSKSTWRCCRAHQGYGDNEAGNGQKREQVHAVEPERPAAPGHANAQVLGAAGSPCAFPPKIRSAQAAPTTRKFNQLYANINVSSFNNYVT